MYAMYVCMYACNACNVLMHVMYVCLYVTWCDAMYVMSVMHIMRCDIMSPPNVPKILVDNACHISSFAISQQTFQELAPEGDNENFNDNLLGFNFLFKAILLFGRVLIHFCIIANNLIVNLAKQIHYTILNLFKHFFEVIHADGPIKFVWNCSSNAWFKKWEKWKPKPGPVFFVAFGFKDKIFLAFVFISKHVVVHKKPGKK